MALVEGVEAVAGVARDVAFEGGVLRFVELTNAPGAVEAPAAHGSIRLSGEA